ncbi:MAG TPA: ABC transporter substrate-binding protein [Aggregatilineales bacterium]|nr:ABC transporter substrate-binding protein [Aggregatilineales bacterium]
MSRSRITFFVIIGLAILVVVGSLIFNAIQTTNQHAQATTAMESTLAVVGTPGSGLVSVVPVYANGVAPTDPLPTYTCAADAFASYYTLEQMQVAGIDTKNGFHLGLIPFQLDGSGGTYDISEDARNELLSQGKIDCLFTTLDSTALSGAGVITAMVDESAGADQLWVNPGKIKILNDLKGMRIAYVDGSVSQFFALYALFVAGLDPKLDVKMIPVNSIDDVVARFKTGQADAVSGWEPNIDDASKSGGAKLIASDKLHVIIDVIMTSRNAISTKKGVVQAFHNAWFQTLKAQFENFPQAAKQLASWGHNDWSGISQASAEKDWRDQLSRIAQAGLAQNVAVMKDTQPVIDRLTTAQVVWGADNVPVYTGRLSDLVDAEFVLASATKSDLSTSGQPINTNFVLASHPSFDQIAPDQGDTLAVLPCTRIDFLPDSPELSTRGKQLLDNCVVPVLNSSTGIYLKIVGSAAWPAPSDPTTTPAYQEKDIHDFALARATSVRDYLVSKGFDKRQFSVDAVVPPPERRNITDGNIQAQDRYVKMTLVTVGR